MLAEGNVGLLTILQYALLGFAPGLLWMWFIHAKDDLEPEPRARVLWVFVLGCLAAFLILQLRPHIEDLLPRREGVAREFADAYVVTALPEELAKWAAFAFGALISRELNEPLDGIVYGAAAGLGFASVENVLYILHTGSPSIVVLRAFTATLGHVAFSGFLGWTCARAKLGTRPRRFLYPLMGLGIAVGLHGTYNVFLSFGGTSKVLSLLVVLPFGLVLLALKLRWSRIRSGDYHPHLTTRGERKARS